VVAAYLEELSSAAAGDGFVMRDGPALEIAGSPGNRVSHVNSVTSTAYRIVSSMQVPPTGKFSPHAHIL